MGILRKVKNKENPYVVMNKEFLDNKVLSFKAKGILSHLLSKPDDWQVYVSQLIKTSKDGRDSVYSGIKELIDEGYVIRKPKRIKGKMDGYDYDVYETPHKQKQHIEIPFTENPHTGIPHTENQQLLSKDSNHVLTELNNDFKNTSDQISFEPVLTPKNETVQLFEYYLEVELVNHKKLTDSMKKSAKMAFKDYSLIELKEMLDRHKQVVEITKSEKQFTVKKRSFAEFFGQKVKDAKILICEEYADDGPKWSRYKGVIESGSVGKQQDDAIANAVQGITRKQHNDEGEDYSDLL